VHTASRHAAGDNCPLQADAETMSLRVRTQVGGMHKPCCRWCVPQHTRHAQENVLAHKPCSACEPSFTYDTCLLALTWSESLLTKLTRMLLNTSAGHARTHAAVSCSCPQELPADKPAFGEVVHAPPQVALKSKHWAASSKQQQQQGTGRQLAAGVSKKHKWQRQPQAQVCSGTSGSHCMQGIHHVGTHATRG
jgi:hypothetical protein